MIDPKRYNIKSLIFVIEVDECYNLPSFNKYYAYVVGRGGGITRIYYIECDYTDRAFDTIIQLAHIRLVNKMMSCIKELREIIEEPITTKTYNYRAIEI